MIVRLGFLVAASIAAYCFKQLNVKKPSSSDSSINPPEDGDSSFEKQQREGEEEEEFTNPKDGLKEQDVEEEEEEEVKLINSVYNPVQTNPEFEDHLPLPIDNFDKKEQDKAYETERTENANERERLRNLVKELHEREVKLEGELFEYHGLKERDSDILELQRQLKIKAVEVDMLNVTINSLQAERKKLQDEVAVGVSAIKDLEMARNKIKELQRQIQLEANQTKGRLLLLKQQVSGLQAKEEEAVKNDADIGKKLKAAKELEEEAVELKKKKVPTATLR